MNVINKDMIINNGVWSYLGGRPNKVNMFILKHIFNKIIRDRRKVQDELRSEAYLLLARNHSSMTLDKITARYIDIEKSITFIEEEILDHE